MRKISYQGGAYRQQLESGVPVYPVACIIMAWTGKANRIPLSLHKLLVQNGVPLKELEQVDDAKLAVYHMNNLSPDVRKQFVSDLGFVVDFLNEGNFKGRKKQKIIHMEALCDMMEAITGDTWFTEQAGRLLEKDKKGGNIMMCEYINMLEARGEARGEENGKKIGEAKLTFLLSKLYDLGRDEEAKKAVRDMEIRQELYKEFQIIES